MASECQRKAANRQNNEEWAKKPRQTTESDGKRRKKIKFKDKSDLIEKRLFKVVYDC
jgi:hypothetical protein